MPNPGLQALPTVDIDVAISRPSRDTSFGFAFVSGEGLNPDDKVVSAVVAGGVSAGKLQKGDVIQSMNGMAVGSLDHAMVLQLVMSATGTVNPGLTGQLGLVFSRQA